MIEKYKWYPIDVLKTNTLEYCEYCVCRIEYTKNTKKIHKYEWDVVCLLYDKNDTKKTYFFNIPKNSKVTHFMCIDLSPMRKLVNKGI